MNNENQKPNYYSILPAEVRYDNELTDSEKILYSEITSLSNKKGYCYASNSYFSKLYSVTTVTISRRISKLEKRGYIHVEIDKSNGNKRRLFIRGINRNVKTPINTDVKTPINTDVKYNNTSNNTTSTNNYSNSPDKENQDTIPYSEVVNYLNMRTDSRYKSSTYKTREKIRARWNEGFRLEDFFTVIDKKCVEWMGDKKMEKYLRPSTLFGTKFEEYLNQLSVKNESESKEDKQDEAMRSLYQKYKDEEE